MTRTDMNYTNNGYKNVGGNDNNAELPVVPYVSVRTTCDLPKSELS